MSIGNKNTNRMGLSKGFAQQAQKPPMIRALGAFGRAAASLNPFTRNNKPTGPRR